MPLTTSHKIENHIATIVLAGRLDGATSPQFLAEVEKIAAEKPKKLVLDLKDLEYMASAGLRILIMAKQKLGAAATIYAVAPQDIVKDAIEISGFHQGLTILDKYDAAIIES